MHLSTTLTLTLSVLLTFTLATPFPPPPLKYTPHQFKRQTVTDENGNILCANGFEDHTHDGCASQINSGTCTRECIPCINGYADHTHDNCPFQANFDTCSYECVGPPLPEGSPQGTGSGTTGSGENSQIPNTS